MNINNLQKNVIIAVVIPMFGSSMHAAKARVHRSELGSLLAGVSEKEDLTRKHQKREKRARKRKDKTNQSRHRVY